MLNTWWAKNGAKTSEFSGFRKLPTRRLAPQRRF
jgi:hypothetical protein